MATTKKVGVRRAAQAQPKAPATSNAKAATAKTGVPAKKGAPVRRGFGGAAAKTGTRPARKRKPLPQFKAPADFKPHFLLLTMSTEADGLFATSIKGVRYQGRFDRDADEKKKFDMSEYDYGTLCGIAARIGGVTYKATNDKKMPVLPKERATFKGAARLPAKQTFQILLRVGRRAADNTLTTGVKQIWQAVPSTKTKGLRLAELAKTDPAYRMIRKSSRFLPAAFVNVQMPPKRTRGRRNQEESEE